MMKYTGTLALGMGVIFGVPAFTLGGGLPGSLTDALADTVRAIDVLTQVEERLETGEAIPAGAVKKLTEVAILDPRGRDELLNTLRNEVGSLQANVDIAEAANAAAMPEIDPLNGTNAFGPVFPGQLPSAGTKLPVAGADLADSGLGGLNIAGVSTGMSSTLRTSIAMSSGSLNSGSATAAPGFNAPITTGPTIVGPEAGSTPVAGSTDAPDSMPTLFDTTANVSTNTTKPKATPAVQSPEGKGYSANPLLQAKACFRAKRYQQGLDLLVGAPKSAEVTYWKAQLEDKLGNLDEAIRLYTLLKDDTTAGEFATKAEDEVKFLTWRRDYENKDSK